MAGRSTFWSLRLEAADDAKKMIRESAMAFYAVAAIQAVIGGFYLGLRLGSDLGPSMFLDAGLYAGLGFWLHRTQSRVAATLLLVLAALGIGVTAVNQFGGGQGGRNIVLAVIVFWAAIRAVLATYKLPALTQEQAVARAAG